MEEKQAPGSKVIIEVIEQGPLKITGNIHLTNLQNHTEEFPSEVYLCRCGKSGNKPYCDESHKKG